MPELAAADVENYTQGRLDKDDPETARMLAAALAAARRYCGWHVSPVLTDVEVVVDGPAGPVLSLPTLNLISVGEISESGASLDVSQLDVSRRGSVRHPYGCWTGRYDAISVTMTHGFTEEAAADWRAAVLSFVDRSSMAATGGRLVAVGPFRWDTESMATGSAFSVAERAVFDQYRLELSP